ncbi:NAD(P)-dependent oxidoreductase [Verrucomicrobiota bacterium]
MRILITEPKDFSSTAVKMLKDAGFSPVPHKGKLADVQNVLMEYEGVIARFGLKLDRSLLGNGTNLKFIAVPATALDHILDRADRDAAEARGVEFISLAGHVGLKEVTSTAEHAFGLLLCLVRNICSAHQSVLRGEWDRDLFLGHELKGKTVGVVGLGRLGMIFAGMAEAFRMRVVYYDPYVNEERYSRCSTLKELAEQSDIVSVHTKLAKETENLLDEDFFDCCKRGMFFVNTARSIIANEGALLNALVAGRVAGAALDVLRDEPATGKRIESDMLEYSRTHSNVVITPHVAGATYEAMRATEIMLAQKIIDKFNPNIT